MQKKLLVMFTLAALAFCSTSAFAAKDVLTPCSVNGSNGLAVVPQVVAVGSSAQVNTFAYAAAELLTAQAGDTGLNTADYNLFSATSGITVNDLRLSPTLTDTPNPVFFVWDNATTCNLYAYFTTDSGVGVKDFFATRTIFFSAPNKTYSVAGATVTISSPASASAIPGLPDTTSTLPSAIKNFFNNPWIPVYSGTVLQNAPLPYCGTSAAQTGYGWCTFNMAGTDIRPEDALYATTRALSTLATTTYAGLGYNQSACLAGTATSNGSVANTVNLQGCPIFDSFGKKKVFNVLKFNLTGGDPFYTGSHVPPYTTVSLGASPELVIVTNADSAGFGATSGSNYTISNVNRGVLSQVFQGNLHCTGDFLPGTANGSGKPIQEIQREPLSGTYNTFEFNAVRTLNGSSNGATTTASVSAWPSNDDRSMESGVNPITGFQNTSCSFPSGGYSIGGGGLTATPPDGTVACGDPISIVTGSSGKGCGTGVRARSVGSSEEVAATMALDGPTGGVTISDGIGFAFWSYGNEGPMATSCGSSTNQTTYNQACNFLGHYLTVDGIDPLFATAGGANDSPANPAGAFNPPQCNFAALPCFKIPFTHVLDGTYPIWSLLRDVTIGTSTTDKTTTPPAVLTLIAYAQYEASQNDRLSDFVPFLNVNTAGLTSLTGSLNLGVFRTHFHQTNNPVNGYVACGGSFTSIPISGAAGGCTVDVGGDMGGEVMTVQSDLDFNADFGSLFSSGKYEFYGQHQ